MHLLFVTQLKHGQAHRDSQYEVFKWNITSSFLSTQYSLRQLFWKSCIPSVVFLPPRVTFCFRV